MARRAARIVTLPQGILALGSDAPVSEIGTKACNLSLLHRLGFNVPPCVFIPTFDTKRLHLPSLTDYRAIIDELSLQLIDILPSDDGWSIRSSATIEDRPGQSHAGRFKTVFIDSAEQLTDAVQAVWDSASCAGIGAASMGVVVQVLIRADHAGVAFSTDPTSEDNTAIIEGVEGMGDALVDGTRTPWRIRLDGSSTRLPSGISRRFTEAIGTGLERLAKDFSMPVDVEWALKDGVLHWLQVRPLTGTSFAAFEVPDTQKNELSGVWVRINHSTAPQMPLIISLNPGGYFNGIGWESALVNDFHYIRRYKKPAGKPDRGKPDELLSKWDIAERVFETSCDSREAVQLGDLDGPALWREIETRIKLNQDVFAAYADGDFLQIRDDTERVLESFVKDVTASTEEASATLARLLGQLDTKTDKKKRLLDKLAALRAELDDDDLRDTDEWHEFMQLFGFEAATSQLYYLPTLRETPDLVVAMVEQLAHRPAVPAPAISWENAADWVASRLGESERAAFRESLLRLRRCMLRTEDDDYLLARCTTLVRDGILCAGARIAKAGMIREANDVFLLHGDELRAALTGRKSFSWFENLAGRRRRFDYCKSLSPPPMIINGRPMTPKSKRGNSVLTGTPASPGTAVGVVLVLDDPFGTVGKSLPVNAVIVTPVVTPALAYSLSGCAAIVTEAGGLASHGAIVARELSIPAVVGVTTARGNLLSGMSVTVDGTAGRIKINSQR